jgi:elongation factor G
MMAISGRVPLAEMDDYLSSLKSISGGEGSFTMELASYEAAPAEVQRTLSGAFKSSGDE